MFGLDFSPANWEPIQLIVEQLALTLFNDNMLQKKHKHHLNKLGWDNSLGGWKEWGFTPATRDSLNCGVRLTDGSIKPTPHHFLMDDNTHCNIFDSYQTQQSVAASIKAIYILLGESDLMTWQDPILFDKLEDVPISYSSHILGQIVNMQCMDIEAPPEFIVNMLRLLKHHGRHHKVIHLQDIKSIMGKLGHIVTTAPWLHFLLPDFYVEIATCLKIHHNHLYMTN